MGRARAFYANSHRSKPPVDTAPLSPLAFGVVGLVGLLETAVTTSLAAGAVGLLVSLLWVRATAVGDRLSLIHI